MNDRKYRFRWPGTLFLVLAVGCSSKTIDGPAAEEEGAVREKFAELQSAIKGHDADKLWKLLDGKSQADADRIAKDIKETHAKSSAEEKAKQEEALGLSGPETAKLTGIGFLKTKRFQKKYDELPESKIEKVVVRGENATVHFLEPDGDHEKLIVVRSDGQWKVWLAMPKASQPLKSAN